MAPLVQLILLAAACGAGASLPGTQECHVTGRSRTRACIIKDLRPDGELNASQCNSEAAVLPAPAMPTAVRTILLQKEWDTFDPEGAPIMRKHQQDLKMGFQSFPHGRDVFGEHLKGTWGILNAWGQPRDVARSGLFHTNYGGDLFIFAAGDPFMPSSSREELRGVIGEDAEAITWNFGTMARNMVNTSIFAAKEGVPLDANGMLLKSFVGEARHLDTRMIAKIMIITLADYMDQLVEINLWRDFNQHATPKFLYPGKMKPEVCLYWITRACNAVRDYLDVIPPIFEDCTAVISYEDELRARDLYWSAIEAEEAPPAARAAKLQEAAGIMPFVAEPFVYLAELHLKDGAWEACAASARKALANFYQMGTHWDKRLPYRQWIHATRSVLMRCTRSLEGNTTLPMTPEGVILTGSMTEEMERVSPGFLTPL